MKNTISVFLIVTCLIGGGIYVSRAVAQKKPNAPAVRTADEPLLAWLGPLPRTLSDEKIRARMVAVMKKIKTDLSSENDVLTFACKTPAQVGPIPMVEAMERYIEQLPESQYDETILRDLDLAASKGNWLARAQLYALIVDSKERPMQYRAVQLLEWLQERKIGAVYAIFGDALAASGYYSGAPGEGITGIDIFAALHNSYPAQNKVGKELKESSDPKLVAVGEKMLACANAALPAYARLFSGDVEKAHKERLQQAKEASLSALHRAVRDTDVAQVERILAAPGVDINAKTIGDQTPLDFALLSPNQSAPIIKLLIQHGAEVANHGAVDKHAAPHDQEELLNLAVKAQPANLQIIDLLMKAGAEPFQTDGVNEYVFRTAAGDSFELYESGENTAILELFLATKKLDPQSDLALEYLEHSATYLKVMERLLAYGISPERSDELLSELVSASSLGTLSKTKKYLQATSRLAQHYPAFARSLKGSSGYAALSQAVYNCNFEFANWLLDAGAPMAISEDPGKLVKTTVERCDKYGLVQDWTEEMELLRKSFLERLHAKNYDFNFDTGNCPAWLSDGGTCQAPDDDKLVKLFLKMGADPYLLYPDQRESALESVINSCRVEVVNLMLAAPPSKRDAQTQRALDRAVRATSREIWSGYNCPDDFMRKTAQKLVAYGARAEDAP